jgi:hypothetical protein
MKTANLILAAAAGLLAATAQAAPTAGLRPVALSQSAAITKAVTGDTWNVEEQGDGYLWASTRGDVGALGQYCNASMGACAWVLVLKGIACNAGEQHPVLVNTDETASHNMIQCMGSVGGLGAAFAFVDFDRVDFAIRHGRLMGIAIPGADEEIGVAKFQLAGAADVVDRMRDALQQRVAAAQQATPGESTPGAPRDADPGAAIGAKPNEP